VRLLEMFLLLELKDRLTHVAQTMQRAITKRWDDHMHHAGMAGLPTAWRDAIHKDNIIPDGTTMERYKEEWSEQYGPKMSKFIVDWFSQFDPTRNKKFTDWILRQWLSDKLWLEDAPKMKNLLTDFEQYKKGITHEFIQRETPLEPNDWKVIKDKNLQDINTWKDYRWLSMVVREVQSMGPVAGVKVKNFLEKPEIQDMMHHPVPDPVATFGADGTHDIEEIYHDEERGEFDTHDWYDWATMSAPEDDETVTTAIKPIFTSDRVAVLQPNSKAAACELGRGTEWCTAATETENAFWDYATGGPMYVIITDKMGKFQFSFDSNQFTDVHDHRLTDEKKAELVKNYPELRKVFGQEALEHGQMWIADPEMVTPEFVNGVIHGEPGERDISPLDLLSTIPIQMDGQADEEALQMIEAHVREKNPIQAWRYVRDATAKDYLAGLLAKDKSMHDYNPATNIMRHAAERGFVLPDEIIDAAIERDGESIMYLSPEQMQQHPDWVLEAIQQQPRMLEYAASTAIIGEPVWGELEDGDDKRRHETIIDVLRRHPKGISAVVLSVMRDPTMVNKLLDRFGTEPWKMAYDKAGSYLGTARPDHNRGMVEKMEKMAATIANHKLKLDYNDLLKFMVHKKILHMDTIHAIESVQGQIPYELQKAIVAMRPDIPLEQMLKGFLHPHPKLLSELSALERSQQSAQPQSSERSEL